MSESNTAPSPPDPIPVPVICDACRAKGQAGDHRFGAIIDILDFKPVHRRAHVNGWTEAHQRAFVIALAMLGSMRKAARAIGRYANGAEQLRKAPGGREFDRACEAALEIYREREYYRVQASLADLAAEHEEELVLIGKRHHHMPDVVRESEMGEEELEALKQRLRQQLMACRRLYLATIANHPKKRKAWQVLVGGRTDWDRARANLPQDNEPFPMSEEDTFKLLNFKQPAMVLTVDGGMMNHHLGLPGPLDPLKAEFAAAERLRNAGHNEDEVRAQLEIRAEYLAKGWTETVDGTLVQPDESANPSSPLGGEDRGAGE
jgi:hypothetical protein